jgi:hypothetical protein
MLIAGGGGGAILMLYVVLVCVGVDAESDTDTVTLKVPNCVGLPAIIPLTAKFNPGGSEEPDASAQV